LLLAAGCASAPETADGLRKRHAGIVFFDIDENYFSVYRDILGQAKKCLEHASSPARTAVEGELDASHMHAHVTVQRIGIFGVTTPLTTDIFMLSANQTRVTTYYLNQRWKKEARLVENWVKADFRGCAP
jgi:hypothetical protein